MEPQIREREERIKHWWLGLGDVNQYQVINPLLTNEATLIENPHIHLVRILRQQENFFFTCKHVLRKTLAPFQLAIIRELWVRPYPILVAARGASKSWLLAVYSILRALFCQGSKIVIVGASMRQAKFVFDYAKDIWDTSPVLREIVGSGKDQGPKNEIDRLVMRLGESFIIALPCGSGQKIRGQRATDIIIEEVATVPEVIISEVIRKFAAVSQSPIERMQKFALMDALKEAGEWTDEHKRVMDLALDVNRTVLSGTAYYAFNHFYKFWKQHRAIIESKGDRQALLKAGVPSAELEHVNWKDYSVIRLPVELLPKGYMDEKTVAQARINDDVGTYNRELGACGTYETRILTAMGIKKLGEVVVGDLVLTHRGRFRRVTKLFCRPYEGDLLQFGCYGTDFPVDFTPEHPFWTGDGWIRADEITGYTCLPSLVDLNSSTQIDLREIVTNFREMNGRIWAKSGGSKLSDEQVQYIQESAGKKSWASLARELGVHHVTVAKVARGCGAVVNPKFTIPAVLQIDYDLGVIMGYYASEGSTFQNITEFALDGHVGIGLEYYVEQLRKSLIKVFGLAVKIYRSKCNVARIVLCSRLAKDFIKWLCPGTAANKYIRPEILFSNADFLKGFITAYWNGDGHLSQTDHKRMITATTISPALAGQIKLVLSYFGIPCSIADRPPGKSKIRGKWYNTKQAYCINIYGENGRRFRESFYQAVAPPKRSLIAKMRQVENQAYHQIADKEISSFDGMVYNLEVEEDNSYCTLVGAVHNCFLEDSNGFYRRTLVESCVVGRPDGPIIHPTLGEVRFSAILRGIPGRRYVMGVDPASESDNFAVVILECWEDHRRIVHCWTTRRDKFRARVKAGAESDKAFYRYVGDKIRELRRLFNIERIALDAMGGGSAGVAEDLRTVDALQGGEQIILPVIVEDEPQDTDDLIGDHILELVYFARADWVIAANHGMRKDFEQKQLLFPEFDTILLANALETDKLSGRALEEEGEVFRLSDTLEDCMWEIEELKDELATIVHTQTGTALRDRWDTPEYKDPITNKKGRLRKDRYSALLMANMSARSLPFYPTQEYEAKGRFARGDFKKKEEEGPFYINPPAWVANKLSKGGSYGVVVRRGR